MVPALLIIIGLAFFIFGIYSLRNSLNIKKNGIKTIGHITSYCKQKEKDSKGDISTYYYPMISFKNDVGHNVNHKYTTGTTFKPKKALPEKIYIYYLEIENKYEVLLENDKLTKWIQIGSIFIGTIFVISTIVVLYLKENNLI